MDITKLSNQQPFSPDEYAAAYDKLLHEGSDIMRLNSANHKAYNNHMITYEHFKAAAEVLAKEILRRR